jgi:REP-associated tyrosine transposase
MSERRFRGLPGGVCSPGLHLVWCPTYRRQILGGRVTARCGEPADQIADEHGWEVVANKVMPDHVGLLVRVGPTDAPAAVVRACKGRTARLLHEQFAYLRDWAKVWWSPSCFVAAVGYVSASAVRRDIEHRCDAVRA